MMEDGSCILDVSSMSAYLTPSIVMPRKSIGRRWQIRSGFGGQIMGRVRLFPKSVRAGVAYGISKDFVIWYAKQSAMLYGEKGIRVVCVSAGKF